MRIVGSREYVRLQPVYEFEAHDSFEVLLWAAVLKTVSLAQIPTKIRVRVFLGFEPQKVDVNELMRCYHRYMSFAVQQPPTYKQFVANMEEKMVDPDFLGDTQLLLRPDEPFDPIEGYKAVKERLIENMQ